MNFHTTATGEKKEKKVEYFLTNAIKFFLQKNCFLKERKILVFEEMLLFF
jgi:hypothetical protein